MSFRSRITQNAALRRVVLATLRTVRMEISIRHPWVKGCKVNLNSYLHKGYWFHGKARELETMQRFDDLLNGGDSVIEVGGHIGYISLYFASLIGAGGRLDVFEPGSNNLPYIRKNLVPANVPSKAQVNLVEAAVGEEAGSIVFYEDQLTGQNNSAIKDFQGLQANAKNANVAAEVRERVVKLVALDEYVGARSLNFVKIDVEGFEYKVLRGMRALMATQRPIIMVEVQADHAEIAEYFAEAGYATFAPDGKRMIVAAGLSDNVFALHTHTHAAQIAQYFEK